MTRFSIFAAILSAFAVANTAEAFQDNPNQIMAVPAGTVIPIKKAKGLCHAFCLEAKVPYAATSQEPLNRVVGKILLTDINGTAAKKSLQSLIDQGKLTVTGADLKNNGNAIQISGSALVAIAKVEFVTHAAFADSRSNSPNIRASDLERLAQRLNDVRKIEVTEINTRNRGEFQFVPPALRKRQSALWQIPSPTTSKSKGDVVEIRSIRVPIAPTSVTFHSLGAQADCSVIMMATGATVIHDIGTSDEEMTSVIAGIPVSNGKKRVALVITHAHRDHYKGMKRLLSHSDVVVEQILIGLPHKQAEQRTGLSQAIFKVLTAKYNLAQGPTPATSVFKLKELTRVSSPIRSLRQIPNAESASIARVEFGGEELSIFGVTNATLTSKNKHDFNLATQFSSRGRRVLDLGDADPKQVRQMLVGHLQALSAVQNLDYDASYKEHCAHLLSIGSRFLPKGLEPAEKQRKQVYERQVLEIDVLKWPHHAWRPLEGQVNLMKAFLKTVRPHEVIISISQEQSQAVKKRVEQIRDLVKKTIAEEKMQGRRLDIKVRTTEQTLRYLSLKNCHQSNRDERPHYADV